MTVIFGAFVPQGWKMELSAIEGAEAKWATTVATARLIEDLGYDSLWVYDHFHNVPRPSHEAVFESWTTLVGTPEQVAEKVAAYVDMGCTGFIPWCPDYPSDQSLRLLAEKVMPEFR